jgi:ATP-dependent Zn protease
VLIALALPNGDTVHKVSIVARGIGSLGYLQALIPLLPIETSWNIKEVRYPAVAKFLREHRAGIQAAKRSKRSEW